MFASNQKLKKEISILKEELKYHKNLVKIYEDTLQKKQDPKEDPRAADIAFDFRNIDVFCIERSTNKETGLGQTVIGYWVETVENGVKTKKAKEWYLFINNDMHKKLIQHYQEHVVEQRRLELPADVRNKVVKK